MVNYERLGSKAQSAPSICSDVSQFVRKKLETKVIAHTVAAILHGLLLREQELCILGQIFFQQAGHPWILQKFQPPCSLVLKPFKSSNLPSKRQEPKRTRWAGRLLRPEGRDPACVVCNGACAGHWGSWAVSMEPLVSSELFQREKFLESQHPSANSGTEFCVSPGETYMPLWTHGFPSRVSNPLYVKEECMGNSPSPGTMGNPYLIPHSSLGLCYFPQDHSVILCLQNTELSLQSAGRPEKELVYF